MSAEQDLFDVIDAAYALLERLDTITTDDFSRGGDRTEREALRAALRLLEAEEDCKAMAATDGNLTAREARELKREMARESNRRRGEGGCVR